MRRRVAVRCEAGIGRAKPPPVHIRTGGGFALVVGLSVRLRACTGRLEAGIV